MNQRLFAQRFGSSLNLHPHFHHIVGDCVFAENEDGSVRVVDLPEPSTVEVEIEKLVFQIAKAVEKRVAKEKPPDAEFENDQDAIMTQVHIESMQQRLPSRSFSTQPNKRPRCAFVHGYSLDANVSVGHENRSALERLLRYGARPAFSHKRLELTANGKVAYKLKRPSHTGQTQTRLRRTSCLSRWRF